MEANQTASLTSPWTFAECCEDGSVGQKFNVPVVATVIGRGGMHPITISCSSVSKQHCEIAMEEGRPVLTDLGSTNGTFVNGRPASRTPLAHGDVVQVGARVFRVLKPQTGELIATTEGDSLPFATTLLEFEKLMEGEGLVPNFQPIVSLDDEHVEGYELLARSKLAELANPAKMFTAAERLGQECALSELVRREGVKEALRLSDCGNLFVNTHPREIVQDRFLASLAELRELASHLPITIEVHEAAVASAQDMLRFRSVLDELSMRLAYDDFGAGQARLQELSEATPDVLKFDIQLIRGLPTATPGRQAMVATLVRMTTELGIAALAEGVETADEAAYCKQLGFDQAQGYYYGRPAPSDAWCNR